jgi:hypothetical protein
LILSILIPHVGRELTRGNVKVNKGMVGKTAVALIMIVLFTVFFFWSRTLLIA